LNQEVCWCSLSSLMGLIVFIRLFEVMLIDRSYYLVILLFQSIEKSFFPAI